MEMRDLRVGESSVDLLLQRYEQSVGVQVSRKRGPLEVRVAV